MGNSQGLTGFIGLGNMGAPMASNLTRAGVPLIVWNRTREKVDALVNLGAHSATTCSEVFSKAKVIVLMLSDEMAMDEVLERGTQAFLDHVCGRTIIHMGTTSAAYSQGLERDVIDAGGKYVEAPVSGSRRPAERGELLVLAAGDPEVLASVTPLLAHLSRKLIPCGSVPAAQRMKLAINLFLIVMVTGLAEAFNFAEHAGVDKVALRAVLDESLMASEVSRAKTEKLSEGDLLAQASIKDVFKNNHLIANAATQIGAAVPLLDVCYALYGETLELGYAQADMTAVIHAIAERTAPRPSCLA